MMTARKLSGVLLLALAAACGSSEKPGTTGPSTTSATGSGGTASTTSTQLAVGGFGGSGGAAPCDPAPDPGSLWAQGAVPYTDPNPTTLCAYRGDVLLVVNTAAI